MASWVRRIKAPTASRAELTSVAIIGGGVAGLTAAYKLAQQGFRVTVFEAASRIGGRIYTDYDAFSPQGQYCEKGGEWIDSTHHDIRNLAHEMGLDLQDISKKRAGEELFYFSGEFHAPKDFLYYDTEINAATGAYVPLARYIGKDRRRAKNNPAYERQLDQMSIDDYLHKAQKELSLPYWLIKSIEVAYKGEFGTNTCEQSALLLVNQIGTGLKRPFEVYGPRQDESQRIKGGNRRLIEALKCAGEGLGVQFHTGWALTRLGYRNNLGQPPVYLKFMHEGQSRHRHYDYAVCALPFTRLREVEGLDELAQRGLLGPDKLQAIRELGYGNIVKIMLGMNGRPWEHNSRFPTRANGSFRTDNPYLQNTWITSVGQKGGDSILTILVAGDEAKQPPATIIRECRKGVAELFGLPEEKIFNHRHAFHIWPRDQFVKASYSSMKPGQYTTLRHCTGTPQANGRLGFAGEHADPELYGYMSGAVRSAVREAKRIAEHARERAPGPPEQGRQAVG